MPLHLTSPVQFVSWPKLSGVASVSIAKQTVFTVLKRNSARDPEKQ